MIGGKVLPVVVLVVVFQAVPVCLAAQNLAVRLVYLVVQSLVALQKAAPLLLVLPVFLAVQNQVVVVLFLVIQAFPVVPVFQVPPVFQVVQFLLVLQVNPVVQADLVVQNLPVVLYRLVVQPAARLVCLVVQLAVAPVFPAAVLPSHLKAVVLQAPPLVLEVVLVFLVLNLPALQVSQVVQVGLQLKISGFQLGMIFGKT